MTTPVERMEAIMASLVQDRSQMDRSNATTNKLNANLGSVQKREDTENPKRKLEAGIGTSATIDNKEVAIGELGSSMTTSATDLKKRKENKNNNPDLGGVLSTHDSTQEGLSTTKALEVTSGEMISVSAKTATPDANIESKGDLLEVASGKMEESKTTNSVNDAPKLTKSQKRNRRKALKKKLNANLGSSEKGEDTSISSAGTGDGENSNSKENEHTKVGNGEMGSSLTTNLNVEVEVQKKMEANPDCGVLSTHESTEEGLSTTKNGDMISAATPDANMVSIGYHSEVASGKMKESEATNKALENKLNANQGSLEKKEDTENPKGKPEIQFYTISQSSIQDNPNTGISSAGNGNEKSSNFDVKEHTEVANGELGSSLTTNFNEEVEVQKSIDNTVSKKRKRNRKEMNNNPDLGKFPNTRESTQEELEVTCNETVNGTEKSKKKPDSEYKRPTLAEILNPQSSHSLEASKCEPDSKKQKSQKLNTNPDSVITLNTHESTQEGSGTTKVPELKKDDSVSAKTATPDANLVPKEQVHTEVGNGNDASKLTKSQKKNRRRALKKKLLKANLGSVEKREDTENPNSIGTSATIDNKTSSSSPAGTNAIDNTTLEKIKGEKMKNSNPDSSDKLSTHESTQEGSCTSKVIEVKSDETVLAKTATIDANMVSKEDHSEVVNGETGESETTNLNVSGKKKRKRKPKSMNKEPILEAARHDNLASNEQKRHKINDNSALGDILSTCGNTSKVPEAVSAGVSQGENHMKDANDVGKEETEPKVLEKKLIILDVNGLLADVVSDLPNDVIADKCITRRAIFKRPYVDEFLSFCFERFHVGIWSSRTMRNLVPVVNFLLGDLKKKLLFLWDGCKCTDSGIGSLDVQYKNIVVKDLRKIWDENGPDNKWVKGAFNESNTLLVDDSPYKGLLNPKYTGIFPASYSYTNSDDNFLGPNGELHTYLEGLAAADDVKTYVEQHPFGQGVIDEQNPHWGFYSRLIERLNNKPLMERLEKGNPWKRRKCC